jgi:hypothetical protein
MKKERNTKINYISAEAGTVVLHWTENYLDKAVRSEVPSILAKVMLEKGIEDEVMASSSMDFASEYGFKDDGDAKKLFQEATKILEKIESNRDHLNQKEVDELMDLFEKIKLDLSDPSFPTRTNRLEAVENMKKVLQIHNYQISEYQPSEGGQ